MFTKEEILEQIRKTTKEYGGIPLGISRFENETGIKETEWERYWPRFSDAQKEAGVKANTFFKPAFDDKLIFEKFISLSRELSRIPVNGELIVRHNADPSFPSIAVFQRFFSKLGGKHSFLSALLKYSENKKYIDIVNLCELSLKKEYTGQPSSNAAVNENLGHVYLAKSGLNYKIGFTFNVDRRRDDITLLLPERFEVMHLIKTDDPKGVEAYWHNRFKGKRLRGEWFKLNSLDVKLFKRWIKIA